MRIPPEKVDEVRQASDIVDVIGAVVKLKKRGKSYLGLCPFHTEKTPSFNVSPDKQMYHCFGCGVGGNVVTFLMEYEKLSFVEAVQSLAERTGISLPKESSTEDAREKEREDLYRVMEEAAAFFSATLSRTAEGEFALTYFHERGFTDETISAFKLGCSPNSYDATSAYLQSKHFTPQAIEKAGLARRRDDGSLYDYFRGRAMFPIFSPTGRVVGFGARKILESDPVQGKYINSPETPIYNKSRQLYELAQTKNDIRSEGAVILVEGYADLITPFQAGVKNIVASSGTALTEEQIKLISNYAKQIIIVYDADSAGSQAALRGIDLILQRDLDVRVVELPAGDDPDTFVRKNGGKEFKKLVNAAGSFVDFIARTAEHEGKLDTPEGATATIRSIVQTIAKINDEIKRESFIKHVAKNYDFPVAKLRDELERFLSSSRTPSPHRVLQSPLRAHSGAGVAKTPQAAVITPVERTLLRAMLEGGREVVDLVFDEMTIDDFVSLPARALAAAVLDRFQDGDTVDLASFIESIEDEDQRRLLAEESLDKYQISRKWEEKGVVIEEANPRTIAVDALYVLQSQKIRAEIKETQQRLDEAARLKQDTKPILQEFQRLLEMERELQTKTSVNLRRATK